MTPERLIVSHELLTSGEKNDFSGGGSISREIQPPRMGNGFSEREELIRNKDERRSFFFLNELLRREFENSIYIRLKKKKRRKEGRNN